MRTPYIPAGGATYGYLRSSRTPTSLARARTHVVTVQAIGQDGVTVVAQDSTASVSFRPSIISLVSRL
jgi:hypothetical protein